MAWRVVVIENPARLSLRDNQLVIAQETEATLPIEDIDALILDGYGMTRPQIYSQHWRPKAPQLSFATKSTYQPAYFCRIHNTHAKPRFHANNLP